MLLRRECKIKLSCSGPRADLSLASYISIRKPLKRVPISSSETETEAPVTRDSRDVLLLYAREGEHGQRVMAALRELIQQTTGGTVSYIQYFCPLVDLHISTS